MRGDRWHPTFLKREFQAGWRQLSLFVLCVFLASIALSVVSGWRNSVDDALAEETKKGAGGDVIAFTTEPFSEELLQASESYDPIFTNEMFTVALAPRTDRTLFSKLKSVEPGYPYYGEVPLRSGVDIHRALKNGLVVEERVLERLEIEVGDDLKVGDRVFTVADVALREPDRPLGMWGVSPRIFIAAEDLDSTGLIRPGSYVERRIHIKLPDPSQAEEVAAELREFAVPDQERVETWERPPVNMERYVDNFFTFLDMMVVLAVSLGGLGMQSTLTAWLRSRTQTVAVARTLGARTEFVVKHYTGLVFLTGALGYFLGLGFAGWILTVSGEYLSSMLPVQVTPALSFAACLESAFLCFVVSVAFASWPLYETSLVRPGLVLRQEEVEATRGVKIAFGASLLLCLFFLLLFMIGDLEKAVKISLGLLGVSLVTGLCSTLVVRALKRRRPKNLVVRTALGSWRAPEAKSELVVFIVSTCLAILYTAVITEQALRQSWIDAMPPESPNLIFLDIQPYQVEEFKKEVGFPMDVYQNLRVRVREINGEPLDRSEKRKSYWKGDGRGELDALPTDELPENDTLVEGASLYSGDGLDQVSVRRRIARALDLAIGDRITFNIQGVPVEATVSSIRLSEREGFKPRFELLFPPGLVEGAPRNVFASTRIPEEEIGPLQTRLAKLYPGIVSMDLSLTIRLIAERLIQMVGLVQYFLWSGIAAGVLILVSATWSARQRRAKESAYYKVMGASTGFLNRVVWMESLILGFTCAGLGLGMAVATSWGLCYWNLEVPFPHMGYGLIWMFCLPAFGVALLGWLVGRKVIFSRPAPYLKSGA